jgi:DegV family protein with EDD domain
MKIAITSDSVIDLTKELLEKYDIKTIPFNFLLGDEDYKDGDITTAEIFDYVSKTGVLPKTSAVNEAQFVEFFEETLKDYDAVIHFDISGEMSTTCNNAINASKQFDGKVEVIDSRALSTGVALLAIYARKLTETESDIHVIAEKVRNRTNDLQVSFVIERLDYLHKGGRCSSLQLLGANVFKIRPKIAVKDGKMGMDGKYRGPMPSVVANYCKDVIAGNPNPDKSVIFITYSSATPEMIKAAHDAVDSLGFENIYETTAGCTIASHCGAHTLGILYFNDGE